MKDEIMSRMKYMKHRIVHMILSFFTTQELEDQLKMRKGLKEKGK